MESATTFSEPKKDDLVSIRLQDLMRSKLEAAMFSRNTKPSPGIVGFLPYDLLPNMSNMVAMKSPANDEVISAVSSGGDVDGTKVHVIVNSEVDNPQLVPAHESDGHQAVSGHGGTLTVPTAYGLDVSSTRAVSDKSVELLSIKQSSNDQPKMKKPMNAFILWSRKQCAKIAETSPGLSAAERGSQLGKMWRALDPSEQQKYYDEAERLRAQPQQCVKRTKEKKPMNAYMVYSCKHRPRLAHENPRMSNAELSTLLGAMWNALQPSDKKKYFDMADELKLMQEKARSGAKTGRTTETRMTSEMTKKMFNAYIIWASEYRSTVSNENPEMSPDEIRTRLGEIWKVMSERDKEKYYEEADRVKLHVGNASTTLEESEKQKCQDEASRLNPQHQIKNPERDLGPVQKAKGKISYLPTASSPSTPTANDACSQDATSTASPEAATCSTSDGIQRVAPHENVANLPAAPTPESDERKDEVAPPFTNVQEDNIQEDNAGPKQQSSKGFRRWRRMNKSSQPMNAFNIFWQKQHFKVIEDNPKMSSAEINIKIGSMWNDLGYSEKQKFFDEAIQLKEQKIENPDESSAEANDKLSSMFYGEAVELKNKHEKKILREKKIKRPLNAFMIWSSQRRSQVANENRGMTNGEISAILGNKWRALAQIEKQKYYDEADRQKKQHQIDHPDWEYKPKPKVRLRPYSYKNPKIPCTPMVLITREDGRQVLCQAAPQQNNMDAVQNTLMTENDIDATSGPLQDTMEVETEANQQRGPTDFQLPDSLGTVSQQAIQHGSQESNAGEQTEIINDPTEGETETSYQTISMKEEPLPAEFEAEIVDETVFVKEEPLSSESESEPEMEDNAILGKHVRKLDTMVDGWIRTALMSAETAMPNSDLSSAPEVPDVASESGKSNEYVPNEQHINEDETVKKEGRNIDIETEYNQDEVMVENDKLCQVTENTNAKTHRTYNCYQCNASFDIDTQLFSHLRTHAAEKPPENYQCPHCKTFFISNYFLIKHKQKCFAEIQKCPHCPRIFATRMGLAVHKRKHARDKCNAILEGAKKKKICR